MAKSCCAKEECKERCAPIIGDCKYCNAKYCALHRLPEVRVRVRHCSCAAGPYPCMPCRFKSSCSKFELFSLQRNSATASCAARFAIALSDVSR
jgi:hypothetical protein